MNFQSYLLLSKSTSAKQQSNIDLIIAVSAIVTLSDIKDVADIIQALVTTLALIIGGAWTYLLFVRKRQRYPRAKIEHKVTQRAASAEANLLSIDIIISNTSDVLLSLVSGEIEVRQVLPLGASFLQMLNSGQLATSHRVELVDWPSLFSYSEDWQGGRIVEIEPGESGQFPYTLLVRVDVKTIYVQTYFRNVNKRRKKLGWSTETFHDVLPGSNKDTTTVKQIDIDERKHTNEATTT
jgi:hypothetical protein